MHDLDFRNIPAVDRRIARGELTTQVSALEAELAKLQSDAAHLANQLTLARQASSETEARIAEVTEESTRLKSVLAERDTALLVSERAKAEVTQLLSELRSALSERDLALQSSEEDRAHTKARLESLREQLEETQAALVDRTTREEEISTCRALADKCIFVIGFGRSNTTITLDILNCAKNALILGEANFFLRNHGENFTETYNRQHREFQNQVTKATNAPEFLPDKPHSWWQWMDDAASFYEFVGEKIALSEYHLSKSPPDAFRAFHEARFLNSRYIFMLRNPIDVLLSSAKLRGIVDDAIMRRICAAWLSFMQLWADFVRVFPRTMTIVSDSFGQATVKQLEDFTGLELGDARLLINPANKRRHKLTEKFPTLVRLRPQLEDLYRHALAAVEDNRVLWQAEQKRNTPPKDGSGSVAITSLGQVWLRAEELRHELDNSLAENGE